MQKEWTAQPDEELKIPEEYIAKLRFEITVLSPKKAFSFRCQKYNSKSDVPGAWTFDDVIIDTSKRNARGEITLKRVTYYDYIELINTGFMVVTAPEEEPVEQPTQ